MKAEQMNKSRHNTIETKKASVDLLYTHKYQYLRIDIPLAETFTPPFWMTPLYFLFSPYNLYWLKTNSFWKFYRFEIRFFLYKRAYTFLYCWEDCLT